MQGTLARYLADPTAITKNALTSNAPDFPGQP